jgi:hypothetical protein
MLPLEQHPPREGCMIDDQHRKRGPVCALRRIVAGLASGLD